MKICGIRIDSTDLVLAALLGFLKLMEIKVGVSEKSGQKSGKRKGESKMCFWKKNKVTKPVVKSELDKQIEKQSEDLKKIAGDVSLMFRHDVTRFDYSEAYLKALIELHPEVKEHPVVLDLAKREEEYQKEKAEEN